MESTIPPILLVGLGKMGGAMLSGWRERGLGSSFAVDPAVQDAAGVDVVAGPADVPDGFVPRAVVLAIKPQMAAGALPAYRRYAGRAVFLSIMAGPTVASLRRALGDDAAVVRAMPNTPAAVRQGITVACAGPAVGEADRMLCDMLLRAIGTVAWVTDEALIDPVTAVSGGGPAYVFLLAELLERAAVEQGIAPDLARLLARQTVAGSGALLAASEADAAELRRAVTSPKGTTERALAVLMEQGAWPDAVSRAVAAATARSRELAG
ncbi:MAG: pyrroline-5-carboxylate reductase [Acidisphaera sp.]|nr:pyrroline-5-carboxylate reductase [Acidisphaera sp.]MBV9812688.1 pyrroline-5-carboxylate reductase [Acetobacteraceae bacterium]